MAQPDEPEVAPDTEATAAPNEQAPEVADPAAEGPKEEAQGEEPESNPGDGVLAPGGPAAQAAPEPLDVPGVLPEKGNCVVTGEVSGQVSLNAIEGVFIDVLKTGFRAQTDVQGKFRIEGLPPGTYTLEASKLGYETATTVATLIEAQAAVANFGLRLKEVDDASTVYTLEEEMVVGEYNGDSPGDLFLDLNVTPTLSSGLSEEDFAKNAVSDAGEAIEKISGANIVDGKFAVVRGLADRYITTTLNGGTISSAVPDRKAVRLDLFPTSVLSGINVDKLYAPYLSGDFGGAAIDIRTKVFPDEPVIDFKLKQEFNPSLPDQMMLSADRDLEYFAGLGENINANEILGGNQRLITTPESDALVAWTTLTNNRSLMPIAKDTEQKQSFSATLGNTFELSEGIKLGVLMAGGMGGEDNYNETRILRQTGQFWDQKEFQRQKEWNLYLAGGLQLGEYNEIRAIYFRKNITQQNVNIGRGIDDGGNNGIYGNTDAFEGVAGRYGAAADLLGNFYEIDPVEQDLEIIQLSGRHQLGKRGPKFSWSSTDSDALEDRPNYSIFRTTLLDFTATDEIYNYNDKYNQSFYTQVDNFFPGSQTFQTLGEARQFLLDQGFSSAVVDNLINTQVLSRYVPIDESLGQIETVALNQFFANPINGLGPLTQRTFQSTMERSEDQSFNFEYPIYFDNSSEDRGLSLGFGMSNVDKMRSTRVGIYGLAFESNDASGNYTGGMPTTDLYDTGQGELLAANPDMISSLLTGSVNAGPFYLDDSLGTLSTPGGRPLINNVDATHAIQSHYVSADLFLGDTFLRGGWRFEKENRSARIVPPAPPLIDLKNRFGTADGNPVTVSERADLPSITAGTALFDGKLKLLAGWSQTTTRPAFYEWVPNETIDLSTGLIRYGNAGLVNAQVENLDFSADWQVNDTTNFRVSFFEKKIQDPIIELFFDSNNIFFDNGDDGNIRGVELELEMAEVGPFSLVSNLTYIDAELNYTVDNGGSPETTTSSFPYQPEWIFNANFGYEHEPWDFGVNLIYNFVGENTTIIRRRSVDPSLVLGAVHSLDIVMRKGFGRDDKGGGWTLGAGIKNLWSTDREFSWDGGAAAVDGQVRNIVGVDRTYFVEAKCSF
ncbi:MAG: carboxypeptidase regulatory-like domain-containing protein [Luteolibacter sp.]